MEDLHFVHIPPAAVVAAADAAAVAAAVVVAAAAAVAVAAAVAAAAVAVAAAAVVAVAAAVVVAVVVDAAAVAAVVVDVQQPAYKITESSILYTNTCISTAQQHLYVPCSFSLLTEALFYLINIICRFQLLFCCACGQISTLR
jgi:hypothetical protein